MRKLLLFILALYSLSAVGQKTDRQKYVRKFKKIAIKEMHRTGIPASITLAQGLLESGNGTSFLAKKANNHFGIKCHKSWHGPYVRLDDDRPQEKFRKYKNAEQSYIDHSRFLTSRDRYNFLFKIKSSNYKKWAKGLKKAGYATDPNYAHRLIKIIEDEKLYQFDNIGKNEIDLIYQINNTNDIALSDRVEVINNRPVIRMKKGDSMFIISKYFKIDMDDLFSYNELIKTDKVKENQLIFLKRKKRRAARGYPYHLVKKGDTPYSIAQEYGMRLKLILRYNRISRDYKLPEGSRIYLRGRAPLVYK
ncbi:LysM peptidoglycan-binding domain-containing protein [Marinilabiliaceae bacterium JC040]|nr:LysM peptidoglycan-binding domain-containing protein [Marinilabiliaceae bacterium JC040]